MILMNSGMDSIHHSVVQKMDDNNNHNNEYDAHFVLDIEGISLMPNLYVIHNLLRCDKHERGNSVVSARSNSVEAFYQLHPEIVEEE